MTTLNTNLLRSKLVDKINRSKAERDQQKLFEKNNGNICEHEWKTYKQIIKIDYSVTVLKNQTREYNGPASPYFIVRGCHKCKSKHYVDMRSS